MSAALAQLQEEADTLREEVRQLREALAPQLAFPTAWRLTPSEATILAALFATPGLRSAPRLMTALHGPGWEVDPRIIDVFVCKLRAKLPAGWIETVRGEGFRLTPPARAAIRAALSHDTLEEDTDMATRQAGSAPARKQINITVDERVAARLAKMASEAGVPPSTYARTLFEAAYAARCAETGDRDLDATVAAALILSGAGLDTEEVARALKTEEVVVLRILDAWRESRGALAA